MTIEPTSDPLAPNAPNVSEQVAAQCKVVSHLAQAIARVHEDYAKLSTAPAFGDIITIVGVRSAALMETLGNTLNEMDACSSQDEWTHPVFEAAQKLFPSDPLAPTPSPGSHADLEGLRKLSFWLQSEIKMKHQDSEAHPESSRLRSFYSGQAIAYENVFGLVKDELIKRRVSRSAPGSVGEDLSGPLAYAEMRRDFWINEAQRLAELVRELGGDPEPRPVSSVTTGAVGDLVTVPRDLLGAACSAIDKKRHAPTVLSELRRYALAASPTAPAGEPVAEDRVTSELVAREAFVAIFLSSTPSHDGHREEAELAWKIGDPSCADFFDLAHLIASNIRPLYEAPTAPAQGGDCWRPIETAPRDGTRFWGKVDDDAISMLWHEGFEAFVSTWRRMQMAAGYTINGKPFEDHSPTAHRPKYWMPMPASPSKTQEG